MTKGSRSRNGENWTRDPRAYTDRLAWDDIQLESTVAPVWSVSVLVGAMIIVSSARRRIFVTLSVSGLHISS